MNVYKIIKFFMFQSIPSFGMYTFKDTPIPLTSRRRCSLTQYLNDQFLQMCALYLSHPYNLPNFFHWVCGATNPSLANLSFQPLEKQYNMPHNYGNTLPNLYYSTLQDTKFYFQSVSTLCLSQSTMLNLLSIQRQHPILCLRDVRAFLNDLACKLQFEIQSPRSLLVVMQLPQPP